MLVNSDCQKNKYDNIKTHFMANKHLCQSCSMPMDSTDLWGTEKDGSKTSEYCKFCYTDGHFTHPDITLEEMKEHMMEVMDKNRLPSEIVEVAINRLPFLKRWSSHITFL